MPGMGTAVGNGQGRGGVRIPRCAQAVGPQAMWQSNGEEWAVT